jgi:hypothetical protein
VIETLKAWQDRRQGRRQQIDDRYRSVQKGASHVCQRWMTSGREDRGESAAVQMVRRGKEDGREYAEQGGSRAVFAVATDHATDGSATGDTMD